MDFTLLDDDDMKFEVLLNGSLKILTLLFYGFIFLKCVFNVFACKMRTNSDTLNKLKGKIY